MTVPFLQKAKEKLVTKLRRIQAEPKKVASGYAFGFLVGTTPLIGLKIWIALLVSTILGWNRPATAIGVYHINAVTGPFFHALAFGVGSLVLGLDLDFVFPKTLDPIVILHAFTANGAIFLALLVGGLALGAPISLILYLASYRMLKKIQPHENRPAIFPAHHRRQRGSGQGNGH